MFKTTSRHAEYNVKTTSRILEELFKILYVLVLLDGKVETIEYLFIDPF